MLRGRSTGEHSLGGGNTLLWQVWGKSGGRDGVVEENASQGPFEVDYKGLTRHSEHVCPMP